MIFVAILSLSNCTNAWDTWNINIQNKVSVSPAFSIPALPSGWSRNYNPNNSNHLSSTPYTTRKYQYLNYYNYTGGQCLLYCGPRSFLIQDSDGLLICQRDNTSSYWGGI
jgi:hypothetical protein